MRIARNLKLALVNAITGRKVRAKDVFAYFEDNPLEKIICAANTHNPDILVAPELIFYDGKRILAEDEKKYIEQRIAQEVNRKDMLVIPGSILWYNPKEGALVKNTSPVITDGKVVAEQMKASSGGCEEIAKEHKLGYAKGPKKSTILPWKGMNIGLEICADHCLGMLKNEGKLVDLHIVTSSGMEHDAWKDCAKDNGYFILCDGYEGYGNEVLQRQEAEKFKLVYPVQGGSFVDIYNLETGVENE